MEDSPPSAPSICTAVPESRTSPTDPSAAADSAFDGQVNAQTEQITAELNKLGQLL